MLSFVLLLLTVKAVGVTFWGLFYDPAALQGGDYTIAGLSLMAAVILGGLWLAGRVNREKAKARVLFD